MSESRGRDLKPSVDAIFYEIFGFETFFRYHNFQNEIDAWDSTVSWLVEILQSAINSFYFNGFVSSHLEKRENTVWKGIKNLAKEWYPLLCRLVWGDLGLWEDVVYSVLP